jgi:uroporphyrinogen-III decarboxylase
MESWPHSGGGGGAGTGAANGGWAGAFATSGAGARTGAGALGGAGGAHASNTYISPKMYEEFDLPYTLELVNTFADAGIITVLHFDANWTKNFPLLRAFPAKKCILHLDGFSNIRKARQILGDRLCIMGDVPPHLMVRGTRDQVAEYCRGLIRDVGKSGGFILSPGCECPMNAKPENVKTLIEIANEEGRYV